MCSIHFIKEGTSNLDANLETTSNNEKWQSPTMAEAMYNRCYKSACSIDSMLLSISTIYWAHLHERVLGIKDSLVWNDLYDKSVSKWPQDGFWSWNNVKVLTHT